jgi:hypothetical protein
MDTCFNALLLDAEQGLRATPRGTEIDVRLPWYRSLPISVVEVGGLRVDDQDVPPGDIRFEISTLPCCACPARSLCREATTKWSCSSTCIRPTCPT